MAFDPKLWGFDEPEADNDFEVGKELFIISASDADFSILTTFSEGIPKPFLKQDDITKLMIKGDIGVIAERSTDTVTFYDNEFKYSFTKLNDPRQSVDISIYPIDNIDEEIVGVKFYNISGRGLSIGKLFISNNIPVDMRQDSIELVCLSNGVDIEAEVRKFLGYGESIESRNSTFTLDLTDGIITLQISAASNIFQISVPQNISFEYLSNWPDALTAEEIRAWIIDNFRVDSQIKTRKSTEEQ
jgi:hypothetical protein